MSDLALLLRSVRAENRIFWRTPIGAFFTLGLPLIMLVLFVALCGEQIMVSLRFEFLVGGVCGCTLGEPLGMSMGRRRIACTPAPWHSCRSPVITSTRADR